MKVITLDFWSGLVIAILIRLGPGLIICGYALQHEDTFQYGFICGLGVASTLSGAVKLYREIRGV